MFRIALPTLVSTSLLAVTACSQAPTGDKFEYFGKADTPGASADAICEAEADGDDDVFQECRDEAATKHCNARGKDALKSTNRAFTPTAVRWACSDVNGVNTNEQDDRGQEYCEYFAVVQLPPEIDGGELPDPAEVGRLGGDGTAQIDLTEDQLFAVEDEVADRPSAVAGQCIFTSWHEDITQELDICDDGECPSLKIERESGSATLPSWMESNDLKMPLEGDFMRMKTSINSNVAAADLVEDCMKSPPKGDLEDEDDPLHDNFFRGCWKSYDLFQTEWRRSDPSVCAAAVRLSECGCGVDTDGDGAADITAKGEIARALVPKQPRNAPITLRGFPLGTWSDADELPNGCRFVNTGDASQTLVACDLTVGDLIGKPDLKQVCREKYGDNVVVHVPVPEAAIVCTPDPDDQYTDSCGQLPWVIGAEGEAPDPEPAQECCRVCRTSKACGDSCIPQSSTCNAEPGCACDG